MIVDQNEDNGLLNVIQSPGALSQINQMVAQGNDQARQDALSSGLIAAGAGLLGYDKSKGPAAGLGAALGGFNQAYDESIKTNKPKVVPLAGGAFVLVQHPDGRQEIVKNEDVAKFLSDQSASKFEQALQKIGYQGQVTRQNQAAQTDNKTAAEFRPMLSSSQSLLSQYDKALDIVGTQGTKAQLQGAFPGIAGAFGGDEVANNKLLQSLAVDETLLNTAKTKGAISDKEMALFKSPIPALTDDRKTVWEPWLKERRAVLEKLSKFYESEVARGEADGGSAPAPSKPSIQSSSIPGLSSGAAKYFQ